MFGLRTALAWPRQLGRRIGDELEVPVYLYGEAAIRPERRNLADVRRGEYEGLVQEIQSPHRRPDFGPARVGPAGAVVVGARPILIAFNVFLQTADVAVARAIASQIRERDGGMQGVKALGLFVGGQAQVSMNLVDYRATSPVAVVKAIRRLAADHSVALDRGELIGLIPRDALPGIGKDSATSEGQIRSATALAAAAEELLLPDLTPRSRAGTRSRHVIRTTGGGGHLPRHLGDVTLTFPAKYLPQPAMARGRNNFISAAKFCSPIVAGCCGNQRFASVLSH